MDFELQEECLDCREVEGTGLHEVDWKDEELSADMLGFRSESLAVAGMIKSKARRQR